MAQSIMPMFTGFLKSLFTGPLMGFGGFVFGALAMYAFMMWKKQYE